jgi:hypothetical protein
MFAGLFRNKRPNYLEFSLVEVCGKRQVTDSIGFTAVRFAELPLPLFRAANLHCMDRFPSAHAGYAEANAAALLNNRTTAQKLLFQTHRLAELLSGARMHQDAGAGCT